MSSTSARNLLHDAGPAGGSMLAEDMGAMATE